MTIWKYTLALILFGLSSASLLAASSETLRVAGTLTQIDGSSFTIADSEGKPVRVLCTDTTDYTRDKKPANERIHREDFKVGDPVRSYYDGANMTARAVRIFENQ